MKPIYWQTYFYFWCRKDTENHCSVPKTEATWAAWRVQNSNSSALFRQILYGLFTFLPDNSCVVSKATEEADLSSVLNEIISLTFISWFTVSPVNIEDATATRKKKSSCPFWMGKHVKQWSRPKLFFPEALAQHLGPHWEEINAFCIKNAESTIHHKASRFS